MHNPGPLPALPRKTKRIFLRTIYIWHALALFTKDRYGDYMKPSEGIPKCVYKKLRTRCKKYGGCWLWICTSKSTDFMNKGKNKKSYLLGAVYVSGVCKTRVFNRLYERQRLKGEYKHSKEYKYQAIIPMYDYARLELETPAHVHEPIAGENRWSGFWTPHKCTELLKIIKKPVFIL